MITAIKKIDLPELFVRRFGVIRTQSEGIVPFTPFEWQNEYLEAAKTHDRIVIDKSREIGSSTIAVLNYTAETALFGGDFLIASYKKDSAMFLFETAKLFLENLIKKVRSVGYPISYNVNTKTELILNNGSHIKAMEMTPTVGRSFRYRRLLATEIAFWKNPFQSWQALQGADVKGARVTVESTPNPDEPEGALFEELINNPLYYKIEADWRVNPNHDEEWHKRKLKGMTDREFAQEYEHNHKKSAGGNLVIPLSSYYECLNKENVPAGEKEFGVDVARFGDDDSVVVIRNGGRTRFLTYRKNDTQELADEVANLFYQEYPQKIKIDAVGVGAGVVDALNRKNLPCEIVEVNESMKATDEKQYFNARAEMYFQLREQIMAGKASIPDDEELKQEIFHTHYKHNKDRIQIESKEQIKKAIKHSPDRLDALALAFYDRDEEVIAAVLGGS